jgi:limonene 1,2-monooxygenase
MPDVHLRNGIFMAPFHPLDEDPTLALQRDLELIEHLDRIGYDEAWIGEHHSAGFEIIASPELFIAAAAERTRRIRLGTGVVSLPYHHPLTVANRIIQLDHMTRGRVIFGAGPGLLPSDAKMLGIPVAKQRDRMAESLDAILRLMAGETVTEKTEWYTLEGAKLHLLPYTRPRPEVCVASTITPSGGRLAGKYGLGMLCVAATQADGFDALGTNWKIANEIAAEHGRTMDPAGLRLVGPMHLAETREQARANVQYGLKKWLDYFSNVNPTAPLTKGDKDPVDELIETGRAVIGTPEDAIAQIDRLLKQQGEFGAFLQLAHNWANFENTKKSYELFARHVSPHFSGANRHRSESYRWANDNAGELMGQAMQAAQAMIQKHHVERAARKAGEKAAKS